MIDKIIERYQIDNLKQYNQLQIELMAESSLDAVEWVKMYAAEFRAVYGQCGGCLGAIKIEWNNKEEK